MSGYVVPLVFSVAPILGSALWGANENPKIKQSANNLFNAIEKRNTSIFKHELICLKSLYADITAFRSTKGLTLIQHLATNHKVEANRYVNWSTVILGDLHIEAKAKRENINFMREAHSSVASIINPSTDEYLTADNPENIAFLLLASTDDVFVADILAGLIDNASADQFARMEALAPRALRAAVTEGSGKTVGVLIKKFKLDPNQRLESGNTLLHIACLMSVKDQVEYHRSYPIRELLENGADPNLRNDAGKVPGEGLNFWSSNDVPILLNHARIAAKEKTNSKLKPKPKH